MLRYEIFLCQENFISPIIYSLLLLGAALQPSSVIAQTTNTPVLTPIVAQVATSYSYNNNAQMVANKANNAGLDPKTLLFIADQESGLNPHPKDGDMDQICSRTGKPKRARGMWQITECYHPEVTDAQAYDPMWSTDWTIKMILNGHCYEWSTCPLKQ